MRVQYSRSRRHFSQETMACWMDERDTVTLG
jgi:hypothetical protein